MNDYLLPDNGKNEFGQLINNLSPQNQNTVSHPSHNRHKIMLVDDQIDVLITIKIRLQTCGFEVNAFNDPLMALSHFSQFVYEYDVVISDIMMPVMTGFEFITKIKAINPDVKIFVISTSENLLDKASSDRHSCDSASIELDGIIHKPTISNDLCRMLLDSL